MAATLHRLTIGMQIPLLLKAALIGGVIALAALAWLPVDVLTRTSLGGHTEHLIAYLGAATMMGLVTRTTRRLVVLSLILIGYAALLEVGQLQAIGRQASFEDFAFSSGGALIGAMLAWSARACWARMTPLLIDLRGTYSDPHRNTPRPAMIVTSRLRRPRGSRL
jgi:hypothetical protein